MPSHVVVLVQRGKYPCDFSTRRPKVAKAQRSIRLRVFPSSRLCVKTVARVQRPTALAGGAMPFDPTLDPVAILAALGITGATTSTPVHGGMDTSLWRV